MTLQLLNGCFTVYYASFYTRSYYRKESAASPPPNGWQHAQFAE
jgi:hypothetical protein